MKKRKRLIQSVIMCVSIMLICLVGFSTTSNMVEIVDEPLALSDKMGTLIEYTAADKMVIPDKYNTGAKGELQKVALNATVNNLVFKADGTGKKNVLDFFYRNKDINGTVIIENCDFSDYLVAVYNEEKADRNIKVIFNNCKFSKFSTNYRGYKISFEFNNCSLNSFAGSNAVFNKCSFGHSYMDGLNAFQNVEVNDCFFSEFTDDSVEGNGYHTDGTHIYGYKDIEAINISYNNCRYEIPAIRLGGDSAKINACLMLQLEYSDGNNISFKNCILNGGGYSIYAHAVKGTKFSNVEFENISLGVGNEYNYIYPDVSQGVTFKNIVSTDSLYVASVWKESGKTHFSVTNDTAQKRTLTILTDKGKFQYFIDACLTGEQLKAGAKYENMPFDVDIVIPEECEYAVCYDTTVEGNVKQLRFVNWTGKDVYLDEEQISEFKSTENNVIISGMCGKNVSYYLTNDGVLTLSGTGATENYNSAKLEPWLDYRYMIKKIVVEEGIDTLGTALFQKCASVSVVELPSTLTTIKQHAFARCINIREIHMPKEVQTVDKNAFLNTIIDKVYCSVEQMSMLSEFGLNCIVEEEEEEIKQEPQTVAEGTCGLKVMYTLDDNGVLFLSGSGNTYSYHSQKRAPWYEYKHLIKEVKIGTGVTQLGHQMFVDCSNMVSVELPASLQKVGDDVFVRCKQLKEITLPKNILVIGKNVFGSSGLQKVIYQGTLMEWNKIQVGKNNEQMNRALTYIE